MMMYNYGNERMTWSNLVLFMEDDLREQVAAEIAPCTDAEFLERYNELHRSRHGDEFATVCN